MKDLNFYLRKLSIHYNQSLSDSKQLDVIKLLIGL